MTNTQMQDEFGRRLTQRLTLGANQLPHDVSERLRAARVQALAKRQRMSLQFAPSLVPSAGGSDSLASGEEEGFGWGRRVASVLPLLALLAGLVAINMVQNDHRASELAEVDAALLTDTLPPSAYSDPGFLQFLKTER